MLELEIGNGFGVKYVGERPGTCSYGDTQNKRETKVQSSSPTPSTDVFFSLRSARRVKQDSKDVLPKTNAKAIRKKLRERANLLCGA